MGVSTTKERLRLLNVALDSGISHFDTAPYYGYGEAERLLGQFLPGKRDQVTITTKYGIQPSALLQARWLNLLARRALKTLPFLRRAIRRNSSHLVQKPTFSASEARSSLDRSLISLNTDYIDLFLLHEPLLEDATSDEILKFLNTELDRGRIRAFGCGGNRENIKSIDGSSSYNGRWFQFEDNILHPELTLLPGRKKITFGPFNLVFGLIGMAMSNDPELPKKWTNQLNVDCTDSTNIARLLQNHCHHRNPEGILLFSTSKEERIRSASKQLSDGNSFSKEQLTLFMELVQELDLVKPKIPVLTARAE